jgi:hypothetical protein
MDPQHMLVRMYLFVCRRYRGQIRAAAQRQSNNDDPNFTDEEVLAIYLFGIAEKKRTVSGIYRYVSNHFSEWFPELPTSCNGFRVRLNRMSAVFAPLVGEALSEIDHPAQREEAMRIVDSMPIMVAKQKRSSQARVASEELANKGYCSSKNTFFYGVKLHVVANRRDGQVPLPDRVSLEPASENDLTVLRRVLPDITGGQLYGDKAYCDGPMKQRLATEQDLDVLTPVKKKKGQENLSAADSLFSKAVSKVRQPIESLFNWIDEKTGIQCASKVRSYRGLLVHAFGRLAAAMLLLSFNS